MKQYAIITWPRPHTSQDEIEKMITADGYIITESHQGIPVTNWNPLGKKVIIVIAETQSPLRISDIIGELAKHCCESAKGIENQAEITTTLAAFRKKPKKK